VSSPFFIGLNAIILAVTDEEPRFLSVRSSTHVLYGELGEGLQGNRWPALPFGPLEPKQDRTLESGLRRWVTEQTALDLGYVEQLYTFGDRNREIGLDGSTPVLSIAYLALVREGGRLGGTGDATWQSAYDFLPWENRRAGDPGTSSALSVVLDDWVRRAPNRGVQEQRRDRIDIAFGLSGAPWDPDRVLERYELLYESESVPEAMRDAIERADRTGQPRPELPDREPQLAARPMAFDHRRMLATALGRVRGKLRYRPVVFELLPPTFTLLQLQRVVEALSGVLLHKQNFRRLVDRAGLVEGTGHADPPVRGRPAELFRFREEVLRERAAPGVGLPGLPGSTHGATT